MNKNSVHQLFETQAQASPLQIAIESNDCVLTYLDLNAECNRIADLLKRQGVKKGDIVGVLMHSCPELVASMLACFKLGAVYQPISHAFSDQRIYQMLTETGSDVLIVRLDSFEQVKHRLASLSIEAPLYVRIGSGFSLSTCNSAGIIEKYTALSATNPHEEINGDDSNYIFYTSGSTGQGKAIEGRNESLSQYVQWEMDEFRPDAGDRVSQIAQLTFDAYLKDILPTLCSGATVVLPSEEERSNYQLLSRWLITKKISILKCVPSLFKRMVREIDQQDQNNFSLRLVLLAGEQVYGRDILDFRKKVASPVELINLYGTTESTILKTFYRIGDIEDPSKSIPVGKAMPGSTVVIMKNHRICRLGEIGEILIKSPYLTKGYVNKSFNQNTFIQNPLVIDKQDIVYRTGDLGRYLEGWNIELIGRKDHQVKYNGIRLEIGEVENAFHQIEGITEVIVICTTQPNDDQDLIAYYTGKSYSEEQLLEKLSIHLNKNILPNFLIHLATMPLNINGKVDRKALPAPSEVADKHSLQDEPSSENEKTLADIWKTVLNRERVGRNISFFALGGSSVKAIQLVSRVFKKFDVMLKIGDVFANPTIEQQAVLVDASRKSKYSGLSESAWPRYHQLSNSQRRIWIMSQGAHKEAFNIPLVFELEGEIVVAILENSINAIIERHEILRTVFFQEAGEIRQKVLNANELHFNLIHEDISNTSDKELQLKVITQVEQEHQFNLETGPLLRIKLVRRDTDRYVLFLNMHHIISDAWSVGIFKKDVLTLYNAFIEKRANPLSPLKYQYHHFVQWQQERDAGEYGLESRRYWMSVFSEDVSPILLPFDFDRPARKAYHGGYETITIDRTEHQAIQDFCHLQGVSLYMFFLAVVNVMWHRYNSNNTDLVVGCPVSGRTHADLEDQIGCYINTIAIRNKIMNGDTFFSLLDRVKSNVLSAFNYQEYPIDKLMEELDINNNAGYNGLFNMCLILQNVEVLNADDNLVGLTVKEREMFQERSIADLTMEFMESEGRIRGKIEYDRGLFKPETISMVARNFNDLLCRVLSNPNELVDHFDITVTNEVKERESDILNAIRQL